MIWQTLNFMDKKMCIGCRIRNQSKPIQNGSLKTTTKLASRRGKPNGEGTIKQLVSQKHSVQCQVTKWIIATDSNATIPKNITDSIYSSLLTVT